MIDHCGIRGVGHECQDGSCGSDAAVGRVDVRLVGSRGLVRDTAVQAAETGPIDDDAGAVEEHPDCDAAGMTFGFLTVPVRLERLRQFGVPVIELQIEVLNDPLQFRPSGASRTCTIQRGHGHVSYGTQLDVVDEEHWVYHGSQIMCRR